MGKDDIHIKFLEKAVELAKENVERGGGPFGAIIVKGEEIIATGSNSVTLSNDPTAHAEVSAIRNACKKLGSFQLTDCTLYTSCEPCPMCLGAIYWARPKKVYFAAKKDDASRVGFDDSFIYKEIDLDYQERSIPFENPDIENFNAPFEAWESKADKTEY